MAKTVTRKKAHPADAEDPKVEDFDIGVKIKALRTSKKKTLQDVANETGFSPALISQIENNNVSPPIATLSKVAKVLGVRVGYFFKDEGPEEGVACAGSERKTGGKIHRETQAFSMRTVGLIFILPSADLRRRPISAAGS